MVKVGVCLSGCGVYDGSEIQEAVFTLLALDRAGAEAVCMAPDIELDEVDHLTGENTGRKRHVLRESARICRGEIKPVSRVSADEIDALVLPGGFGAAKNLSNFAEAGPAATLEPSLAELARQVVGAGKPLGAICIAPALAALLFKEREGAVRLTIGNDPGTAAALEKLGAVHQEKEVDQICFDEEHRVVSTPAYMLGPGPARVWQGIEALVDKVVELARGA